MRDIEGNELAVGDEVYYARKSNYRAKGELVRVTITKITSEVWMGKYHTATPQRQVIKVK